MAAEMGCFKPFFHLILYAQQPDRTAPIHYDFSTAKLNFLYHLQPLIQEKPSIAQHHKSRVTTKQKLP
jgi:hypothetical protein